MAGKIDPMHQFTVEPLVPLHIGKYDISLTNSAAWMLATLAVIFAFMAMGMKRQLVPGRWQMAVEGLTGFIDDLVKVNIGPEGKKFTPYVFSLFTFILVANLLGLLPLAIVPGWHAFTSTSHFSITGVLALLSFSLVLIVGFWRHGFHFFSLFVPQGTPIYMLPLAIVPGWHAFTSTSHFSITGLLAIMSFSLVLIVGFWRHGFHFFSLFVPHGTPWYMLPLIIPIEIVSFLVRPFSLALRLFVAMMSGHILMDVFGSFIANGFASESAVGVGVGLVSFVFIVGVGALELLVCALQAYVFALLTSLYLNDAINLH